MARMSPSEKESMLEKYRAVKHTLKLKERYFMIFEYRCGIADSTKHTISDTGKRFGISSSRAGQIIARVEYELGYRK